MPRAARRRGSSTASESDFEPIDGRYFRTHRRPPYHDRRTSDSHRRHQSASGFRHRDRDGNVFIDILNEQNQSQSPERSRPRARSSSRPRADISDIEGEIDRIQRKIRQNRRRQDAQEDRMQDHLGQQQQHRRARSDSPGDHMELRLRLEKLERERLERELRGRHGSRSRGRHHRRRDSSSSSSSSSVGEDELRDRVRRARSRARERTREELEQEYELRRHRHKDRADHEYHHAEDAILLERMRALEQQHAEREHEERIREKIEAQRNKEEAEQSEKKKHDEALKKKAVEEHLRKEADKELAEREEEEKMQKEMEDRMRPILTAQGFSEQEIKDILNGGVVEVGEPYKCVKIDSSEVSPEALDSFGIPWEWESSRGGWIIVRQELTTTLYDRLADHTRRMRQRLLPAPGRRSSDSNVVEVKANDQDQDRVYLVRRRSRGRMSRFFGV